MRNFENESLRLTQKGDRNLWLKTKSWPLGAVVGRLARVLDRDGLSCARYRLSRETTRSIWNTP